MKKIIGVFIVMLLICTPIVTTSNILSIYKKNLAVQIMGSKEHTIEADSDTFIVEPNVGFEDQNWNFRGDLFVGNAVGEWGSQRSTLLYFDISELPLNAVIIASELCLTKLDPYADPMIPMEIRVSRCTSSWDEDDVKWGNKPSTSSPEIVNDDPEQYTWDVTDIVQYWWSNPSENYGVMLIPNNPSDPYEVEFHGRLCSSHPLRRPLLYITYEGDDIPPWTPEECPPDDIDPTLSIDISPPDHNPGHKLITATGNDNQGLRAMEIGLDGPSGTYKANWNSEMLCGDTPIDLSLSCSLSFGTHTIKAWAKDGNGRYCHNTMTFDIGSGTSPTLSISFSSASPTSVWPEDGQMIEVLIHAEDLSEGIRRIDVGVENAYLSSSWPQFRRSWIYSPPYPPYIDEKFSFINLFVPHHISNPLSLSYNNIQVKASAEDVEFLTSGIITHLVPVQRPYLWDYGLPYENLEGPDLGWQRMFDIFGKDECLIYEFKLLDIVVTTPLAWLTYELLVKDCCKGGHCVGMSCVSCLHNYWQFSVWDEFTHRGLDDYMRPGDMDPFFWEHLKLRRSIERFHGAQFSKSSLENMLPQYSIQFLSENNRYYTFVNDILPVIEDDIENNRQGYLSLTDIMPMSFADVLDIRGHAVVPWHIEHISSDVKRIYVYDPNRNGSSLLSEWETQTRYKTGEDSSGNPIYSGLCDYNEYDEFELYPYIDISYDNFEFNLDGASDIWTGFIAYVPYNDAIHDDYGFEHIWDYIYDLIP